MDINLIRKKLQELLEIGSRELYEDNPDKMDSDQLIPTPNIIADDVSRLFFLGLNKGLFYIERGVRFCSPRVFRHNAGRG